MNQIAQQPVDPDSALLTLLQKSFQPIIAEQQFSPFQSVSAIEPTRDICAMISLTGPVSIMLVFALDHALAWRLMQTEVQALGLDENEEMLEAVLGEITNVIGGNATAQFASADNHIHLSLPFIFRAAKVRAGVGEVQIKRSSLCTGLGILDAYFVSPAKLTFTESV
jgi:CheY-specific phosphatase CheX